MILTNHKLKFIALLAAALLALTVVLYLKPQSATRSAAAGELLVQGLDPSKLTKIELKEGEKTVTLTQDAAGGFAVKEKKDYPADLQDINNLLVGLLDIRIAAEPQISSPAECGLDPKKPEKGTITLFGKDSTEAKEEKPLLTVRVGKSTERGTFVEWKDKVYLTEKVFEFSADPLNYIDQTLYNAPAKDIVRIDIDNGGKKFSFVREKDGGLKLTDLPAGKVENGDESWGVREGVARISFENVQPAAGVAFKPEFTAVLTMETTMKYRVEIAKDKDGKHLAVVSALPPEQAKLEESMRLRTTTGKKELAEKDAVLTANDTAKAFREKTAGWVYELSDWAAKRLLTPYDKLLKDAPKEEPKPAAEDAKKDTAKDAAGVKPADAPVAAPAE